MRKKLISMSLYGNRPMYLNGAIRNAQLLPDIFPGWILRIYCSDDTDTHQLEALGCEIKKMGTSHLHSGMFWRFLAAWDEDAERVLMRDADSRLNIRDAACVQDWEDSENIAHCIMDHPHHSSFPMSGGMWGIRSGALTLPFKIKEVLERSIKLKQKRVADMKFLSRYVHPSVEDSLLRHSSVETKWPSLPFPSHEPYDGFVGQQYDDEDMPIWP